MFLVNIGDNKKKITLNLDTNKSYKYIESKLNKIGIIDVYYIKIKDLSINIIKESSNFKNQRIYDENDTLYDLYRLVQLIKAYPNTVEQLKNIGEYSLDNAREILFANEMNKHKLHKGVITDPNLMNYEQVNIFNVPAIMTDIRVDRNKLPKGLYLYETQEDDCRDYEITLLGKRIMMNFSTSVITTKPLLLINGYREINEEKDIEYLQQPSIDLNEFIKQQKFISKKQEKNR